MSHISLEAKDVSVSFGGLNVFRNLNFQLHRGEKHAIIGPNGAGKSTFVGILTGLVSPKSGDVFLNGESILEDSPQSRVKRGLVRTFQINTLFMDLNPLESVMIALTQREGISGPSFKSTARQNQLIAEAMAILEQFGLGGSELSRVSELPYGKQRILEVALALALKPSVLLLDEPAAGLSTAQGHELFDRLASLPTDTAILFIEHDMSLVFRYAERISLLASGKILASGCPEDIRINPVVREIYLGS